MREIAIPMLNEFKRRIPVVFDDSREKPVGLFIIEKRKIEEEEFLKSMAQPHKHDHSYKAVKQRNKFFERKRK